MTSILLALPSELKMEVVKSLAPNICKRDAIPGECCTMLKDIKAIFREKPRRDLWALSATCKTMRTFLGPLAYRVVKLKFNDEGLLGLHPGPGRLPTSYRDTVFLALSYASPYSRGSVLDLNSDDSETSEEADGLVQDSHEDGPEHSDEMDIPRSSNQGSVDKKDLSSGDERPEASEEEDKVKDHDPNEDEFEHSDQTHAIANHLSDIGGSIGFVEMASEDDSDDEGYESEYIRLALGFENANDRAEHVGEMDAAVEVDDDGDGTEQREMHVVERVRHSGTLHPQQFDLGDFIYTDLELTFRDILKRFCSLTTLHLSYFPLSIANLCALEHLKALRTLSIKSPDTRRKVEHPNFDHLHRVYSLPNVSNLSIFVHDEDQAPHIINAIKLFEDSLTSISISGAYYESEDGYFDMDISEQILNQGLCTKRIKLRRIKYLNIERFPLFAKCLRRIMIQYRDGWQTITADCIGIGGFLPVFYLIDLMRLVTGEHFDPINIKEYEKIAERYGGLVIDEDLKGLFEALIWRTPVAKFVCGFTTVETKEGQRRVLDKLEIYFARARSPSITEKNLRLSDLLQVFAACMPTFRALRILGLATENVAPMETAETYYELRDTVITLCHNYLPSAERVTVRWGTVRQFSWIEGRIFENDEEYVKRLWKYEPIDGDNRF